jgi:uncharacterized protein (TIGR03067 family)
VLVVSGLIMLLSGCGRWDPRPAVSQAPKPSPPPKIAPPPIEQPQPPPSKQPDPLPKADKEAPLGKEAAADLEKFQGTWILIKHDTGTPAKEPATGRLVVIGDKYEFTLNGRSNPGTIRLNPAKSPKEIDADAGDPAEGQVSKLLGLYELEGDTQRSIFGAAGGPRPTDFTVKAGSGRQLFVFKKEKKDDKPLDK